MNINNIIMVYMDICGSCNARCRWCVTGRRGHPLGPMMSFNDFAACIERLVDMGVLVEGQTLQLYNWGEPTLNPDLDKMLIFLAEHKLRGGISTNGIKEYIPSDMAVQGFGNLVLSVSGMTDASEMKMHGFPAKQVLANMSVLVERLRKTGWSENCRMAFHAYQHNLVEVSAAIDWCDARNISFTPSYAYFNDFEVAAAFLDRTMDKDSIYRAARELILYYVDDLIASMPAGWICSLRQSQFVLDSSCNVLTCCALPWNHADCILGSVHSLDIAEIESMKSNKKVCLNCERSGLAWWATHPQGQKELLELAYEHRLRRHLRELTPKPIRKLLGKMISR